MISDVRVHFRSRPTRHANARWRGVGPAIALGIAALGLGPLAAAGCGSEPDPGFLPVKRVLGETGIHPGQFRYPRGMDMFDHNGTPHLAIVDKTSRIQLIELSTGESIGSIRTLKSDLGMPTGLTVAPFPGETDTPALWVADTHNHQVIVYRLPFDNDGRPTASALSFGSYGHGPGQFIYPTDIAVHAPAGMPEVVYVSEYGGNDRINVFRIAADDAGQPSFVFERQIGFSGVAMDAPENDPAALARPQSIVLRNGGRELVAVNTGRHFLVRFDTESGEPTGWTLGDTDTDGNPIRPMRHPQGISLLDEDTALITEFGASAVRVLDLDSGRTVSIHGGAGRLVGELATPWTSVVVGDELVILDSGNDRVQVIDWDEVSR